LEGQSHHFSIGRSNGFALFSPLLRFSYRKVLFLVVSFIFVITLGFAFLFRNEITDWEDHVVARDMVETGEMFYMQRGTPN